MKTKLYTICDESGIVRYVGRTSKSLPSRFARHLEESKRGKDKSHRCNWIRSVLARGFVPQIKLICEVNGDGYKEEQDLIKFFRAIGADLVNSTDGGPGVPGLRGQHHSEDARKKISQGLKGIIRSPETRRKMSESKRKRFTPDQLTQWAADMAKARAAKTGGPRSAETKEKLRQANLGHKMSPEAIQKRSATWRSRPDLMAQTRAMQKSRWLNRTKTTNS